MSSVGTSVQQASTPQGQSSSNTNGVSISFVLGDWVLMAGIYQLDLQHNLETLDVNADFFENSVSEIIVDRFEVLNTNTIRIFASMDPDCRFEGKVVVVAI